MVLRFFRRDRADNLEHVQALLLGMLANDRHSFDLATSALLAGADPTVVGPELRATDRKVNEDERAIRRELIVHASVHGTVHVPAILVYMSIVKDAERIGDYAKNIYDLAADRRDFVDAPDAEELRDFATQVSRMITEAAGAFGNDNLEATRTIIAAGDALQDTFDAHITALVTSSDPPKGAVARALLFRYLKRTVSHLMNLLSAVVMPVDQLDYFDEPGSPGGQN